MQIRCFRRPDETASKKMERREPDRDDDHRRVVSRGSEVVDVRASRRATGNSYVVTDAMKVVQK